MPLVPVVKGLPVLLPPHNDSPDFGTPGQHYHIDYRYCTDLPEQERVIFSDEEPVWEVRDTIRDDYQLVNSSMMVLFLLTRTHMKASLSECGRCPHRGLFVANGQCPGHGLTFKKDGRVDSKLYLQLIDIPEGRKRITRREMREWVAQKYGVFSFYFGPDSEYIGKEVIGIEVVNEAGRNLARIRFKETHQIPKNGCTVSGTIR